MNNKGKKIILSLITVVIMSVSLVFANTVLAVERTLTKYTANDSASYVISLTRTGYKVYNTGNSGYIQYNQVDVDNGYMPFGTPFVEAKNYKIQSVVPINSGTYYIKLSGTGTGYGIVEY